MLQTLSKLATFAGTFIGTFGLQRLFGLFSSSILLPTVISTILSLLIYKQIFRYRGRQRRLSLFSQSMVNGFADQCNAPPTIINAWMYFENLPGLDHNIREFGQKIVSKYHRFQSYVQIDQNGYCVWSDNVQMEIKDKFFVHFVNNDQEAHELATRIAATPFQHDFNIKVAVNTATTLNQLEFKDKQDGNFDKKNEQNNIGKNTPLWEMHHIVNLGLYNGDKSKYNVDSLHHSHVDPDLNIDTRRYQEVKPNTVILPTITKNDKRGQNNDPKLRSTHHIMVARVDHTIGDGIALLNAMGRITTDENGVEIAKKMFEPRKSTSTPPQNLKKQPPSILSTLVSPFHKILSLFKSIIATASLPTGIFDTPTSYNQVTTGQLTRYNNVRSIATVPTVHLDNIKAIRTMYNNGIFSAKNNQNENAIPPLPCTINDVLFNATSGALRRLAIYNESQGIFTSQLPPSTTKTQQQITHPIFTQTASQSPTPSPLCRALLPIAFPRSIEALNNPETALTNMFTFLSANMFIEVVDPIDRLAAITACTTELKNSPAALVSFVLSKFSTWLLPPFLAQDAAAQLFSRHSVVFSNVPGPQGDLFYCGEKVMGIQMVYPNVITQVGIISLNNHIFMNFTLDPKEIPNGERLGQYVIDELKDMMERAGEKEGVGKWIEPFGK
jgi:hypothetical protein